MIIFYYCIKLFGDIARFIYFSKKTESKENLNQEKNELKMTQCEKCKIYIPKSEAFIKNGKIFCKKDYDE